MLSIDKDQMMIEHYKEVLTVSESCVRIGFDIYDIQITGTDLHILALTACEVYLAGHIESIVFLYEK